jgi:hypothetical protein
VDPSLTLADLPGLDARLMLPAGWTYAVRKLDAPLLLKVNGEAFVIQDDLNNSYQRVTPADMNPSGMLPVLGDGTGTPCSSDTECVGLTASHCLISPAASFCTVQGCAPASCGTPYKCCHSCDPAYASLLPFTGSACIPEMATSQLTGTTGCTCD